MNSNYEMKWNAGEKTKVMCSGPSNVLDKTSVAIADIECVAGKEFKVNGARKNFKNIICKNKVTGDVQATGLSCGRGAGTQYNLGFKAGNQFVTFIESCYVTAHGSVLYTHNPLHGDAVFSGCVTEYRPDFKLDGTVPQVATLPDYTDWNMQKARFSQLSQNLGNRFTPANKFDRGHLTSYCDAIFPTWKHVTQFYLNTAPEWARVNKANWKRVEAMVRGKAKELGRTLDVYTGTHDLLKIDNVFMRLLPNNYVAVPKWFWKIIRDPATNEGIAFVTLNNIFATSVTPICRNVCDRYNWNHEKFSDYSRGFTYCCTIQSLREVVRTVPVAADTKSVMWKSPAPPA